MSKLHNENNRAATILAQILHDSQFSVVEKGEVVFYNKGLRVRKVLGRNKRENNHNLYPTFPFSFRQRICANCLFRSLAGETQRGFLPLVKSTNPIRFGCVLKEVDITCFQLLLSIVVFLSVNKMAEVRWSVDLFSFRYSVPVPVPCFDVVNNKFILSSTNSTLLLFFQTKRPV